MQNAMPNGEGGMMAILGADIETINKIFKENNQLQCYVANDNSAGQIVVSGKTSSLHKLENLLTEKKIKFVKLPVSAPFHSPLMRNATLEMQNKINDAIFSNPKVNIISNVTANPENKSVKTIAHSTNRKTS